MAEPHAPAIAFRADASLGLGAGHVMRCLTLADELRRHGAACRFICREQDGDLNAEILARGYPLHPLKDSPEDIAPEADREEYQRRDAAATDAALGRAACTAVVVDHYRLGRRWERELASNGRRIIVIDDLADRGHECQLLVDQNLGRIEAHYRGLVPAACRILSGPRFALIRAEFGRCRPYSLERRAAGCLRKLFISMGGFDHSDMTSQILVALRHAPLAPDSQVTVVLGRGSPWLERVRSEASRMPWATEVVVGTPRMAELMADSDLAIGAAGGTAWERCCLGLPTLIAAAADNQNLGADALIGAHAAYGLGSPQEFARTIPQAVRTFSDPRRLVDMSLAASAVVDGFGANRVALRIADLVGHVHAA